MRVRTATLAALAVASLALTASAATVTYPGTSFPMTSTDWGVGTMPFPSVVLTVPQFDNSGGKILTKVTLSLDGSILATLGMESTDASPQTLTSVASALITASGPSALSVNVTPSSNQSFNATVYDGTTDFGGTSGITYPNISAADSGSASISSGFGPYIGLGTVNVDASATGTSSITGPGNFDSLILTSAAAAVSVTYEYTMVPTPTAAVGGLLLLGGLSAARVRRVRASI